MKLTMVLALLLIAALVVTLRSRQRRARTAAAAAALARQRAARRPRVPDVSNNLKGVTASQTIEPLKPRGTGPAPGGDERAA